VFESNTPGVWEGQVLTAGNYGILARLFVNTSKVLYWKPGNANELRIQPIFKKIENRPIRISDFLAISLDAKEFFHDR